MCAPESAPVVVQGSASDFETSWIEQINNETHYLPRSQANVITEAEVNDIMHILR